MGRYASQLQRLLGLPEPPGGIPFGSFRPADVPAAIADLVRQLGNSKPFPGTTRSRRRRAGFSPTISSIPTRTSACWRSNPDRGKRISSATAIPWSGGSRLPAYLRHIRERDPDFVGNFWRMRSRRHRRAALDTSVLSRRGSTNSRKAPSRKRSPSSCTREVGAGVSGVRPRRGDSTTAGQMTPVITSSSVFHDMTDLGRASSHTQSLPTQLPDEITTPLNMVHPDTGGHVAVVAQAERDDPSDITETSSTSSDPPDAHLPGCSGSSST